MKVTIVINAESPKGCMDAVWECWQIWKEGKQPLSGNGNRTFHDEVWDYKVETEGMVWPKTNGDGI